MTSGVILYGPPGSGKDTVDAALRALRPEYRHFERMKVGAGNTTGYRMATVDELDILRRQGALIWENSQYGSTYVVDMPALSETLSRGIPILHLGQAEGVVAVMHATSDTRWTVVALRCSRATAADRLVRRDRRDLAARLAVWDVTPELPDADLAIDTDVIAPDESARFIDAIVKPIWLQ